MQNNEKRPKVSVLVTAFNHEQYARMAVENILNQSGDFNLELIYCDDCSTDKTLSLVQEIQANDTRLKIISKKNNVGMVRNFISGLEQCDGDYIAYCDGDDYWNCDRKLSIQLEALSQNEDCSFSFHDMQVVNDIGGNLYRWSESRKTHNWTTGRKPYEEIMKSDLILLHASSLIFRRSAVDFKFLKMIDERVTGLDYALLLMLANHKNGMGYYFQERMASYRKHSNSVSASRKSSENIFNVLREIEHLEQLANKYFNNKFSAYCTQNRRGHVIAAVKSLIEVCHDKKSLNNYYDITRVIFSNIHANVISFRDAIYILRKSWKKLFISSKEDTENQS